NERLTREQYATLLKDLLKETIDCCHRALAKAHMTAADLGALLMVGGSTYGQWVQEAVGAAFGIEAQIYNPDVCVAAGAALKAAELPVVASAGGLDLVLDVPAISALRSIDVTGRVGMTAGGASSTEGLAIRVIAPGGAMLGPTPLGSGSRFLFPDVRLAGDGPSAFTADVLDATGTSLLTKGFTVVYDPAQARATEISTNLPKSLYLLTATGMRLIAEEGRPLPARCA